MLLLCAGMNVLLAQINAPTLSSPSNGATLSSAVDVTFSWSSVTGAGHYILVWDTVSSFDSPAFRTSTTTSTSRTIDMKFGTKYYWRVCATNTNNTDTSAWSAVRNFTTCSTVTLSSPSNGSTLSSAVDVTFSWSSITGAGHYILAWDTVPSFDSPAFRTYTTTSTSNTFDMKFGTKYYWRVCATNYYDTDTSAWSAVRNFTTTYAPTLSSPSDGTVYSSTIKPTLSWNTITGASKYIYQCDTTPTFDSPLAETYTTTSTSVEKQSLRFNTTYYWRVCATNYYNTDTSAWSAVRTFTTCDAPTLSSPSNGSTLSTVAPTAYYNTITGAGGYLIQLSKDADFATYEEYSLASSNNGITLNRLEFGTTYYWRVCAFNTNSSDTSAWSEVWSFTTTNGVPTLSTPANGSTLTTVQPTLYYNTISGAGGYLMQWSEDPDFATYEEYSLSSSYNGLTLTRLKFSTTYYWRVCALNNNSTDTSAWSEVWHFTTTYGVPTLSTPSDGSTLTTVRPTLYYNTISGAGGYLMQWSEDADFATCEEFSLGSSSNGLTLTRLKFSTTYYWRVCAINNNSTDTSAWSDVWSFTTANGVPTLVSPADGYVYPSTVKPLLRLEAVTGASGYLFHWSEDSTFATYSSYTMSSSYTGLNVNGLKFGTTYYWRVFSITANYADTSASSAVWSFTTTDAPTITAPNDGTVLTNSISPNIQWTEIVGATKYLYQCDTSMSFNSPLLRNYTTEYSSGGKYPLNLSFGKAYYLRMRATNTDESDTSAWSAVRTFITSDAPVLNSPSNGYVYSSSVNPTLKCETIRNIGKYIYQWDTTSNFNSPLCRSTVQTSTSVTVGPLKLGTTYYWRMCATNYNDSDTSSWSAVWSFTTGGSIPTLASPSNGSTAVRLRPTLDWNAVSSCDYYDYECDTTPQFNSPELQSGAIAAGTSEIRLNQLRYGTTYYWRVRIRLNSDTSSWSTVWSFTTAGTIALTSPSNGTTLYRYLHPTLDWDFINDGDYYEYQYDLSPDFDSPELVSGLVAVGTSEVELTAPMRFGATYYWRVREYTSIDTTPWSATWSFTTPGEIALVSPANGSTLSRTLNPTLDWDFINDGDYYEYQYDLSPDFDSPELVSGLVAVGTSEVELTAPMRFGATYYWRVREYTSIDTTPWSATWSFTTPGEIALVSPANGTTNVGASTTLDWDYIRGGTIYEYQYDVTPAFNSAELVEGSIQVGTSQVTISNLEENHLYYWRVRELSAVDTTPWSEVWHFSTRMQPIFTDVYDTACDSYTWNGQTYTQSGEYTHQFVTALQADSTVTLHLTVYPSVTSTSSVTICESDLPYHYVNGDIDTTFEIGTPNLSVFHFQFSTSHGCDSTVILTLNVRSANYTELTETACGNYTWNDEVYEESGDYVQTFTNAAGCDSVVTLHLTIFTANYADFADNACGSYTWNGEVYEESGDYVQTFSNANGCDSTVTLHLTVYQPETELVELTLCENDLPYHYVNGDIDTTFEIGTPQLSTFNFQLLTQHGCDSTVTLTLTIEPCDTNGINENGMANLTLYPNPTTGMVNVQFTMNNVQLGAGEIQVLDVYGRLLQTVETCHGASLQTTQIDLSHYATGIYLVRWVNGGKVMAVKKVVRR